MHSYVVGNFKGLRSVDPLAPEGAKVALDVDLDLPGAIRNRPGRSYYSSGDSGGYTGTVYRLIDGSAIATGAKYALSASKLHEVKTTTIASATVSPDTGVATDVIIFGTPSTGSRVYVSDSNGLRRYSAGSFTNIGTTTTPRGGFLAVQSRDARLVCAYSAINATPVSSRVHFSDAGAPETWTSTNFVDLNPGDGEVITGMQQLGDLLVVFKETRAYVFYGNSTDSTGNPVFNYRTVNLGDRIIPSARAGRFGSDGQAIYYHAGRGIYRMAGGAPALISAYVTASLPTDLTIAANSFVYPTADKVFVGYAGSASYLLVMDKLSGEWVEYFISGNCVLDASLPRTAYIFDGSAVRLTTLDPTAPDELGSTLTGHYQTHDLDCGVPARKVLMEAWVQGTWDGSMTLTITSDSATTGGGVSLATGASYAPVRNGLAANGYTFNAAFAATGTFTVSRIGFDLDDSKGRR